MIDYVLDQTGAKKSFYVGHSQGGATSMVMLSSRPEFNKKILQAHLLAPAVFMKHFPHTILKNLAGELGRLTTAEGYIDFSKRSPLSIIEGFNEAWCQRNSPVLKMCQLSISLLCGRNKGEVEFDSTILSTLLGYMSHSASVKQFEHFLQSYHRGEFRQYDNGSKNMAIYGSPLPPAYNLSVVTAPIYIYSGSCDLLVAEKDIEHLRDVLPNVQSYKNFKNYNHCDFNYGKNSRALYQNDILKAMNSEN